VGKNILIFSDGTGQRGGLLFDECRSNIYKLYRATRCGPDSIINPAEQLAYYDPGIGTEPGGLGFFSRRWRKVYNVVSQATGLGLTMNIIDCYTAIIRMWQPGDRIFLFGFSRGAYTVRCLGAVLSFCGVPTAGADGKPIRRDDASARAIAKVAVKKVYQHVSSPKDTEYLGQRQALARWFRERYRSEDAPPYFIGVFDTVAAIANSGAIVSLSVAVLVMALAAGCLLGAIFSDALSHFSLLGLMAVITGVTGVGMLAALLCANVRYAVGLRDYSFWETFHFTSPRMKFYDEDLDTKVGYARHAIALDENRHSFQRVPWGDPKEWRDTGAGNPPWLVQMCFPGNHSDIGGSYPENESRLSDIALKWMIDEARAVPGAIKVDESVLMLYPDPWGPQHDECKTSLFRFGRKITRTPRPGETLHPSVLERMAAEKVLHHDDMKPYRPEALRNHVIHRPYVVAGTEALRPGPLPSPSGYGEGRPAFVRAVRDPRFREGAARVQHAKSGPPVFVRTASRKP
jgi:uncharacterized protein (DUF2235 family)